MVALFNERPEFEIPQKAKSNEWYTPAKYIEAARLVMGGIDLDPASCEMANRTVKAARYYTAQENGLAQEWYGKIWLNPPYGRTNGTLGGYRSWQGAFVKRLVNEYQQGNINQAIVLLLGNSCFRDYFQPFWEHPVCFHDNDIVFEKADGSIGNFGFGTIFVYLGPNEAKFIEVFSQFGTIAKRVSPSKSKPVNLSLWEERD